MGFSESKDKSLEEILDQEKNPDTWATTSFMKLIDAKVGIEIKNQLSTTSKGLGDLASRIMTAATKIIDSNKKLAKSQDFHSWVIIVLTTLLVIVGGLQVWTLYWTSRPERTIEMIEALNQWNDSQKAMPNNTNQ